MLFESPVACMKVPPYDWTKHEEITFSRNGFETRDEVIGGVTGLLSCGQMFIALKFAMHDKVKVVIFGMQKIPI